MPTSVLRYSVFWNQPLRLPRWFRKATLEENNLLMGKPWLYTIDFFYVDRMRKAKIRKLMAISWLSIFTRFFTCKFQIWMKFFNFSKNSSSFSSLSFQIKKMSSMYLSHTEGFTASVSIQLFSTLSMKIHAYGGANLVPMAVPEISCLTFESNSKKLFWAQVLPCQPNLQTELFYLIFLLTFRALL